MNKENMDSLHRDSLVGAFLIPKGDSKMPMKPRRPCRQPGCKELADYGEQFCPEHKKQDNYEYNHYRRDPRTKNMYGPAWKRIRARYVAEHPLCELCLKEGMYTPVEQVHHIKPLADGGDHSRDNLMSLCASCHAKAHGQLGTRLPHRE